MKHKKLIISVILVLLLSAGIIYAQEFQSVDEINSKINTLKSLNVNGFNYKRLQEGSIDVTVIIQSLYEEAAMYKNLAQLRAEFEGLPSEVFANSRVTKIDTEAGAGVGTTTEESQAALQASITSKEITFDDSWNPIASNVKIKFSKGKWVWCKDTAYNPADCNEEDEFKEITDNDPKQDTFKSSNYYSILHQLIKQNFDAGAEKILAAYGSLRNNDVSIDFDIEDGGKVVVEKNTGSGLKYTIKSDGDSEEYVGININDALKALKKLLIGGEVNIPGELCFPISESTFISNSDDWGSRRQNEDGSFRCHAGNDLTYADSDGFGEVIAIDDGEVTAILGGPLSAWTDCVEEGIHHPVVALLIYHKNLGVTINYGELDPFEVYVKVGDQIKKGQSLGIANYCETLHIEVYDGKVTKTIPWSSNGKTIELVKNYCADNSFDVPETLEDPRPLIKSLYTNNQPNFCPFIVPDKGDVLKPIYNSANNQANEEIKDSIEKSLVFERFIETLNSKISFTKDIPIIFNDCNGDTMLKFDFDDTIKLCYDAGVGFKNTLRNNDKMINVMLFASMHELGHGLDILYPQVKKIELTSEAKADEFAVYIFLNFWSSGDKVILDAGENFLKSPPLVAALNDNHPSNLDRLDTLYCLVYGSDPNKYSYLVSEGWLPSLRANGCQNEYNQMNQKWNTALAPYIKSNKAEQTGVTVSQTADLEVQLSAYIETKAAEYDIDPIFIKSIIKAESDWNPKSVSECGAAGIIQLMPHTSIDANKEGAHIDNILNPVPGTNEVYVSGCNTVYGHALQDYVKDKSLAQLQQEDDRFNNEKAIEAVIIYINSYVKPKLIANNFPLSLKNVAAGYNMGPTGVVNALQQGDIPSNVKENYVDVVLAEYKTEYANADENSIVFLQSLTTPPVTGAFLETPPNFRVAFLGDSGAGVNARKVLELIKNEGADMVVHAGDMGYDKTPSEWEQNVIEILDPGSSIKFPYFFSQGNHDTASWNINGGYRDILKSRFDDNGVTFTGDINNLGGKTSFTYNNLFFAFLGPGENSNTAGTGHASFANEQLSKSNSLWKICVWHRNMEEMQVGGKTDETGWPVYETCRQHGAIIATAHEHSYARTKVLSDIINQEVVSGADTLDITPGQTFVFHSGLGGNSIRPQLRCLGESPNPYAIPYGCKQEWARIYTSNQGAKYGVLFIDFNVDGDPRKATGEFVNIDGDIIDTFTIINNA